VRLVREGKRADSIVTSKPTSASPLSDARMTRAGTSGAQGS
jgi:hypothetical protein